MKDWIVTDRDRELFERELNSFVPAVVFDAHAHWFRHRDFKGGALGWVLGDHNGIRHHVVTCRLRKATPVPSLPK